MIDALVPPGVRGKWHRLRYEKCLQQAASGHQHPRERELDKGPGDANGRLPIADLAGGTAPSPWMPRSRWLTAGASAPAPRRGMEARSKTRSSLMRRPHRFSIRRGTCNTNIATGWRVTICPVGTAHGVMHM